MWRLFIVRWLFPPWKTQLEWGVEQCRQILWQHVLMMRVSCRLICYSIVVFILLMLLKQYSTTQPGVVPKLVATFLSLTVSFIRLVVTWCWARDQKMVIFMQLVLKPDPDRLLGLPGFPMSFSFQNFGTWPIYDMVLLISCHPDKTVKIQVYRKPTHTDQYLHFQFRHPIHHKSGVVRTLMDRKDMLVSVYTLGMHWRAAAIQSGLSTKWSTTNVRKGKRQ